jgi:pyruvate, water dikinase
MTMAFSGKGHRVRMCLEVVALSAHEILDGVKEMIRLAVEGCRRDQIHSGPCGQALSDYPDMAEYLVELGIDSMSLNPDSVLKTTRRVLELECLRDGIRPSENESVRT